MDHYQEPGMSDSHYEQISVQQSQQSQPMTYGTDPHASPSVHDDIHVQEHQSSQMPVHDAMSNLNLENQIPSTSGGIVDSPSNGRVTRARTRGTYNKNIKITKNIGMRILYICSVKTAIIRLV